MSEYVVLKRQGGETEIGVDNPDGSERVVPVSWVEVGTVEAASDLAAIKAVAKDSQVDLSAGAVAVPSRSWRPRKAEVRREERTLWS